MSDLEVNPDDDDRRLMGLVAEGDDAALRLIIERHHGRLVGYLTAQLGSTATAEELTFEVFIRLHRSASRWRPEAKLSTFLFHIAHNLLLNEFRRQSRKRVGNLDTTPEPSDSTPSSQRALADIQEAFALAVRGLPEDQRTAILLLVQQDLSYEAIAEIMGVKVPAVKTWIHRARVRLRELMGSDFRTET